MSSPRRALLRHHGQCGKPHAYLEIIIEADIFHNTGLFYIKTCY